MYTSLFTICKVYSRGHFRQANLPFARSIRDYVMKNQSINNKKSSPTLNSRGKNIWQHPHN